MLSIFQIAIIGLLISIRGIRQNHMGLVFRRGKLHRRVHPGWRLTIPLFESLLRIDSTNTPLMQALSADLLPTNTRVEQVKSLIGQYSK